MDFGWLRSWFKPSQPSKQNPPKGTWAFRVRGVPQDWDRAKLKAFLGDHGLADPTVPSLALEIHGRSQTATVSFRNSHHQPQIFPTKGALTIPLPAPSGQDNRSSSLTLDDGFLGITTLHAPPPEDHKIDIIAISGLGGHAFGSFKDRHGEHMWLRDALPNNITDDGKPIARVMVYGYESSLPQSNSFQNLEDLGAAFHSHLRRLTAAATFQPIIFIAHSLGGLIVKQILIYLSKSKDGEDQKLMRAVYGLVFFGVPHGGMDIQSLISMVGDGPNRFLLESIGSANSQVLSTQQREFLLALGGQGQSEIVCFYETRMSPTAIKGENGKWTMTGPDAILVSKLSATHCRPWEDGTQYICPINRTHSEIVKFGPEDHEYENALGRIEALIRRALISRKSSPRPTLSQEVQECLKSLAFEQMENRAHDVERAIAGTCEWLLRHGTYLSWAASNQGMLWIKGKPGVGKSTLLKYAFSNQRHTPSARDSDLVLSFFFHGRGDDLQKTPLGFFRSLLHQILRQVPEALSDLVDTFERNCREIGNPSEKWQWHLEELWRFFESCLPRILAVRPVWLFVDALDECGEPAAVRLALNFKSLLDKSSVTTVGRLHICFSCRHYPIPPDLDGVVEICVEDENGDDIFTYVQHKLSECSVRKASAILELVTAGASGIFMWARLVVERVLYLDRQRATWKKIEEEIRSTPSDMDKLYLDHIHRMSDKPASLKLIQWICFAARPLTLVELHWAMAVDADCPHKSLQQCEGADDYGDDDMEKRVTALSCGLVECVTSSETRIVQFIHQSVKDYFIKKGLSALDSTLSSTDAAIGMAHFQLSRTCIRYLSMEEISQSQSFESRELINDFPFLHYATTKWITHTKQSDDQGVPQEDLLELFCWPSYVLMSQWQRIYRTIDRYSYNCPEKGTSLVHILARYQISGALSDILCNVCHTTKNIDAKDKSGRTPLSWAAENGHEGIVKLLIATGQVKVNAKDKSGRTPLLWAAENGHEGVVKLLIATGQVEVDSKNEFGQTPLSQAASNGHEAIVKLLIATGQVEVDAKDKSGRTPLSRAVINGYEAVSKLLIATGQVKVDSKDKFGRTPLSWAARIGHEGVVKLLIATGQVEVGSKDKSGQTPLSRAASNGHEAIVKLLIATGQVEVNAKDKSGRTPLLWAAARGREGVVKLLIATGQVEVDFKDESGRTPLSQAAENGHEGVVKLLIATGQVEVDVKDKSGRTPLLWAVINSHEGVVKLLIATGQVKVDSKNEFG